MILVQRKRSAEPAEGNRQRDIPRISVTLQQVKRVVREFERQLPEGVKRTVLVGENNEIDFRLLVPFLHGLPDRKFYMSRESYEIFAEEDRLIPYWLDIVQRAVDDYVADRKTLPIIPGDRRRKVSYALLRKHYYLKEQPPIDFYLTHYENLISHRPLGRL